jgi:hypothetical protein
VPAFTVFHTPPEPTATYHVLGRAGSIAMSAMRPDMKAGPIARSFEPVEGLAGEARGGVGGSGPGAPARRQDHGERADGEGGEESSAHCGPPVEEHDGPTLPKTRPRGLAARGPVSSTGQGRGRPGRRLT